ncbi:Anaerobic glycerol-3-phosphate dehydrogenase subunit A (EC [Olavius algarvensis associated proteobacterium Delta 3]|nr:Anaerobic glycerol-3-phosphate dehydrogenase subunit A (EC [Olavius algarvensis associated proteobacterium Delta 3]
MEHIIVIGGGIGGAIAHDLALRGFKVTLLEKGELLSGSTGRHHGLLHSGARYALHDVETARECMVENRILRRIAPEGLEQNDGLFIAVDEEDMTYHFPFLEQCRAAGIPAEEMILSTARRLEPNLSPHVKAAIKVPDAAMDAWRLAMHFFATAKFNGADIRPYSEVTGMLKQGATVSGVQVLDHRNRREYTLGGDIIINAAGPWAGIVAEQVGIHIPIKPAPGVMVGIDARLANMVINRLHPAGEGDIIIPQRNLSLLGTSVWLADNPEPLDVPPAHVRQMVTLCAQLVPKVRETPIHSAWTAARPLVVDDPLEEPTKITRGFECIDHESRDGVAGFISVFGGKATTMRAMAEEIVDLVCTKTGRSIPCRTKETSLMHWRRFYKN